MAVGFGVGVVMSTYLVGTRLRLTPPPLLCFVFISKVVVSLDLIGVLLQIGLLALSLF